MASYKPLVLAILGWLLLSAGLQGLAGESLFAASLDLPSPSVFRLLKVVQHPVPRF